MRVLLKGLLAEAQTQQPPIGTVEKAKFPSRA